MTFFGEKKSHTLVDQQAFLRSDNLKRQKKKRLQKLLVLLFMFFIGLFLLGSLFLRLPSLYSKVAKPFNNIQSEYYQSKSISFDKRTNLILANIHEEKLKELALASLEPGAKKVVVLKIPLDTLVFDADGSHSLSDLISIQDSKVTDFDRLSFALLETIGYIPEGYIIGSNSSDFISQKSLDQIVASTSFTPSFFWNLRENKNYLDEHLYTNLTIAQFYELTSELKKIRPERFEVIEIAKFKTPSRTIDQMGLNNEVAVKLNDAKIRQGNYAVEVINASGIDGLGLIVKNILNNLGVNIIVTSSKEELQDKSLIQIPEGKNVLVERLEGFTKARVEEDKEVNSFDARLILGKDFGQMFDY